MDDATAVLEPARNDALLAREAQQDALACALALEQCELMAAEVRAASDEAIRNEDVDAQRDASNLLTQISQIKGAIRSGTVKAASFSQALSGLRATVDKAYDNASDESELIEKKAEKTAEIAASHRAAPSPYSSAAKVGAAGKSLGMAARRAAADDGDDTPAERKKYVRDTTGKRFLRKATSEAGRAATSVLNTITLGMVGEQNIDEALSTGATAIDRTLGGAEAVASGDHRAIDKTGLTFGRGVKNALNDTGLVSQETAQNIGHTATVAAQSAGHAIAHARNATVNTAKAATAAVTSTAHEAKDKATSYAQSWTKLGKEVQELLPALQKSSFAKGLDADHDGKVELNEVMAMLKKAGVTDMKLIDRDGNGDISSQEMVTAMVKAHVARSK